MLCLRLAHVHCSHLVFLQLRDDIVQGKFVVPTEVSVELAGLAAQVQFGDYDPKVHGTSYLNDIDFVEAQVCVIVFRPCKRWLN